MCTLSIHRPIQGRPPGPKILKSQHTLFIIFEKLCGTILHQQPIGLNFTFAVSSDFETRAETEEETWLWTDFPTDGWMTPSLLRSVLTGPTEIHRRRGVEAES